MVNNIYIPFPKELYNLIVVRSNGEIDPAAIAASQVETWLEHVKFDPDLWTEEGLAQFEQEHEALDKKIYGEANRGFQWQEVYLPNGSELRMTYKGKNYYASVRHERVASEYGKRHTPSQWACAVANHTSRNAWRDIYVKITGEDKWQSASSLRHLTSIGGA